MVSVKLNQSSLGFGFESWQCLRAACLYSPLPAAVLVASQWLCADGHVPMAMHPCLVWMCSPVCGSSDALLQGVCLLMAWSEPS